ncbi:MAG: hypothetical protein CVU12_01385 [Bacteroidetes bacterium HGW-Bacteroidetes-7]|nr:MAG: hypothetical protein CVU12_01385 [Bacteroidetes bacterium HGW-Bacteroidetes-7]
MWCLAKANFRDKYVSLKVGKGMTTIHVKAGQFLFGRFKAENELGIDGSTIYKWMQKFASDAFGNMIILESNNQYTLVTITNWAIYQDEGEHGVTTKGQPKDNHVTAEEHPCNTTNKEKNIKNDNNVKERSEIAKRFQPPTEEEVKAYCFEKGFDVDPENFVAFYASKGWMVGSNKMKDWKAAVVTWSKRPKKNGDTRTHINSYWDKEILCTPGDDRGSSTL